MAAHDNVNKYQFHRQEDFPDRTSFLVYKGNQEVGGLHVSHSDPETGYEWQEEGPPPHTVSGMKFARGHSAAAMTAVGIAAENALAHGATLKPDSDLSEHSSKLVKGLQRRGLVTSDRSSEVSNNMSFMEPWHTPEDERVGFRLNTETVSSGRNFIRKALKEGRTWD